MNIFRKSHAEFESKHAAQKGAETEVLRAVYVTVSRKKPSSSILSSVALPFFFPPNFDDSTKRRFPSPERRDAFTFASCRELGERERGSGAVEIRPFSGTNEGSCP